MSWLIFEKFLTLKCEILLNQNNLDKMIKKDLEKNYWVPDLLIKALFLGGEINEQKFNFFMTLKNQRNCILHENTRSNYVDADNFRRFCLKEIKNLINLLLNIN